MAHIHPDPDATPITVVDPAWLALSAACTDEAATITGREDLIVKVAPGAGRGAPGCFLPPSAAIELDGNLLGEADPASAAPWSPRDRDRYPVAWGVLVHEGGHARHSAWTLPPGTPEATAAAALLLEEAREERAHVTRRPGDRRWLRAAVDALVTPDPATVTPWTAAQAAALVLARADAGVLDPEEVAPVATAVEGAIGADRLAELRAVWTAAFDLADDDAEGMLALARRWCELTDVDPDGPDPSEPSPDADAGDTPAEPGSAVAAAVAATVATVTDAEAAEREAAATAERDAAERDRERAAARTAEASAREAGSLAAARVFPRDPTVHGHAAVGLRRATWTTRPPTPAEQAAARHLAVALRRAAYRERTATRVTSAVPPGRLRVRAALTASAQRAAGQQPTAQPWTRTARRHVPTPPLRLGIAADVSSSMTAATAPMSSAAWIAAQAATWCDARSATVAFGSAVTPVITPGERPGRVRVFTAPDGTERFCQAVDALDGALGLSQPGAVRLLVVASDGGFTQDERDGGTARLDRLTRRGCGVLWIAFGDLWEMDHSETVILKDPAAAADVIAAAAARALRGG
jgi:hypothetical protein